MPEDVISSSEEVTHRSVTIYTEAMPERAKAILEGNYQPLTEVKDDPKRWYAETLLDQFEPEELKNKGITRHQSLFTTPIPYQGGNPMPGKVNLELVANTNGLYIADATHISEIITPWIGRFTLKDNLYIKSIIDFTDERITREEFETMWNSLSPEDREKLTTMNENLAKEYWNSVTSYADYIKGHMDFEEPEILMAPGAKILSAKISA